MRRAAALPAEIKNRLSGAERGLVAAELLAAPVPLGAAHRPRHRQVVREAALGRTFGAILGSGAQDFVMAPSAEPFHQLLVVQAVGERADVLGRGRSVLEY